MERRGLLWMVLLALCLSLCACGGEKGEEAPDGQSVEALLVSNDKAPFSSAGFTLDGEEADIHICKQSKPQEKMHIRNIIQK